MASRELKRRMWTLGIFVTPVLVVQATAVFLGRGDPAGAQASTTADTSVSPTASAASIKWTPAQIAAAQYIHDLKTKPFAETPFLYELEENPPPVEPEPEVVIEVPTTQLPTFSLQAVMATETDKQALINGRPYRQGQIVRGTSWTVLSIDVESRQVIMKDSRSDQTMTIRVELPR